MLWTVGQTVGTQTGFRGRHLAKLKIERITKGGQVVIGRQRFRANGRQVGGGPWLFVWTADHEARWLTQEAERQASHDRATAAHKRRERERKLDDEALTTALDYLKLGRTKTPQLQRAIVLIERWIGGDNA